MRVAALNLMAGNVVMVRTPPTCRRRRRLRAAAAEAVHRKALTPTCMHQGSALLLITTRGRGVALTGSEGAEQSWPRGWQEPQEVYWSWRVVRADRVGRRRWDKTVARARHGRIFDGGRCCAALSVSSSSTRSPTSSSTDSRSPVGAHAGDPFDESTTPPLCRAREPRRSERTDHRRRGSRREGDPLR